MAKGSFVNALHALGLVSLVLILQRGDATTTFAVGGSNGWCVPSDNNGAAYNQWAEKMRFQVGDSLRFVYKSGDSVLQVSKQDYDSCTTTSPINKYTDGNTEFRLAKSGPYYFISGNKDNCNKNEKLVVVVMADRKAMNSPPSPAAPAPAPVVSDHEQQPPAASPPTVGGATLGPASPPTDDSQVPSAESNPPNNGAASFATTVVGSLGAFVGSSIILAF